MVEVKLKHDEISFQKKCKTSQGCLRITILIIVEAVDKEATFDSGGYGEGRVGGRVRARLQKCFDLRRRINRFKLAG